MVILLQMKKTQFLLFFFIFIFFKIALSQYNSVLSSGNWYKIATNQNSVYKLDYSDLNSMGIDISDVNISNIKIYGNGGGMLPSLNSDFRYDDLIENSIKIHDLNNNNFFDYEDYILFYGQSPHVWKYDSISQNFNHHRHLYSDNVYYFINVDQERTGKRIQEKPIVINATTNISSFNDYQIHELETYNLIKSGKKWMGESFNFDKNQFFDFNFPDINSNYSLDIKTSVAARSLTSSEFRVRANSSFIGLISIPNIVTNFATEYAKIREKNFSYISNTSNVSINLEYLSDNSSAEAWLDFIQINYRRNLIMSDDFMIFRNLKSSEHSIGQFEIENASLINVWDITDPTNITQIKTLINNNQVLFNDSLNKFCEYIAFKNSSYKTPYLIGKINNQNLHNISSNIEYVIVTHPKFTNAAIRLSEFHQNESGLVTLVVTPDQIYNEFSSGMQDVTAIRDFLKMLYQRPESMLKYLLLFGDGSYDPKDRIPNNTNYIPTYQSVNSTDPTKSYVTDDYFGLLDSHEGLFVNDLIDIGIGRLPVSSLNQANVIVDKIIRYYSNENYGAWRNNVTFIADDGDANDGNTHMWQADSLANIVDDSYPNINITKIYLDNYLQESTPGGPRSQATQDAINNRINKGSLLVNYTGHGGVLGWAQERILEIEQIQSWDNQAMPLFMTATCKFSYFDDPSKMSAGEYVLLNPNGGAIGLLSTTRLVYSAPNYNLNNKFINVLFEKNNNEYPTLGQIFKKTKQLSGSAMNNRNFTLLGDPALKLAYPKLNIETTEIGDTLKALETVTIDGKILNDYGLYDFNGKVYITVLDKEITRSTLGQESCTPMPYRDQNNIIYKGLASVVNGEFSFSFIVPKDISYKYGNGKISYYAVEDNNMLDASGSDENFIIGGSGDNIIYDYDEAEISLFMNNRDFLNGGITNRNPVLIADIFDISGINTVGNGIGHDITAILNNKNSEPYILNDYYQAVRDDFTRGFISFPLSSLDLGEHTLTLKVWDVFNNSSEKTINFTVVDGADFTIEDFSCYPNPFQYSTSFYFEHNQANQLLDIELSIYSINGRLVKKINKQFNDDGYKLGPILWDGTNDFGARVSNGIYIAQLNANRKDGQFLSKSLRLIIMPQ